MCSDQFCTERQVYGFRGFDVCLCPVRGRHFERRGTQRQALIRLSAERSSNMSTFVLFSRAKGLLASLMSRSAHTAIQSRESSPKPVALRETASEEKQSLESRLVKHVSAYRDLQSALELGTPLDQAKDSRFLVQDAKSLAAQIASMPGYQEVEPLFEAHRVLVDHWRSSWTDSGVSPTAYRARLKGLVLFIRSQRHLAYLQAFS